MFTGMAAVAGDQIEFAHQEMQRQLALRIEQLETSYAAERRKSQLLAEALLLVPPTKTRFPGVSVDVTAEQGEAQNRPGGDFYDAYMVDRENIALVLGDVCGHGITAALRVPEIKYTLRALLGEYGAPDYSLMRLNQLLCANSNWSADSLTPFAIVSVIVVNTMTGRASCAIAGSDFPLVMRLHGTVDTVGARAMPLGVDAGEMYQLDEFALQPGEMIVMATDGITEARHGTAMLGQNGLTELASQAWKARHTVRPAFVGQHILNGARRFNGAALRDDATVMTVARNAG